MTDWNIKVIAHLHDPPEKAYDYSPEHIRRSGMYMQNLGVPATALKEKSPDHAAAAADRFIFPKAGRNLGDGVTFRHPLSGEVALGTGDFPSEAQAQEILSATLPDFNNPDISEKERFWLLWRLWIHFAADISTTPVGLNGKRGNLAYLPADTRIPDGSIWHHMSIVSALQTTMDESGHIRPAFLLFQLGPVQEFISQGRSTRDMWSGSYMLSWMMAHLLNRLSDTYGPDCVIFPNLRGQPLIDWLNKETLENAQYTSGEKASKSYWKDLELGAKGNHDLVLTPNLPNRLLAIVPQGCESEIESILQEVFDYNNPESEWRRIADACYEGLCKDHREPDGGQSLWDSQLRNFWQQSWQIYPWQEEPETISIFKQIPLRKNSVLDVERKVAFSIPEKLKDTRCYSVMGDGSCSNGKLHIGWPWMAHYQIAGYLLDARRQTRDFPSWNSRTTGNSIETGRHHRDAYSGREEALATLGWIEDLRKKNGPLCSLFRHQDELGAVNLLKRTWHRYYLDEKHNFAKSHLRFPSVIGIASAPWINYVTRRLEGETPDKELIKTLEHFFQDLNELADGNDVLDVDAGDNKSPIHKRIQSADACIFHRYYWERFIGGVESQDSDVEEIQTSLNRVYKACGQVPPSSYFAVMALDGDEIGKWLSGEKTPAVRDVMAAGAVSWFESSMGPDEGTKKMVADWLHSNRPISPSYHLQFSEALSNFGIYCARRIVRAHGGELVYSGGDDVLAFLPATEAIACAQGLRYAFQGRSNDLVHHHGGVYKSIFHGDSPSGFLQLLEGSRFSGGRRKCEPSWPFLVPGPRATVSVGICIGHIREPLQDMIQEAQAAEKRAKGEFGRNAIAVSLYKRSGEIIHWGTQFSSDHSATSEESAALRILEFIQSPGIGRPDPQNPTREASISGKFPYRLAELLLPYQSFGAKDTDSSAQTDNISITDIKKEDPMTSELAGVVEKELAWALDQHAQDLADEKKSSLISMAGQYLKELVSAGRPLTDFINLFSIEAFIGRQGE